MNANIATHKTVCIECGDIELVQVKPHIDEKNYCQECYWRRRQLIQNK